MFPSTFFVRSVFPRTYYPGGAAGLAQPSPGVYAPRQARLLWFVREDRPVVVVSGTMPPLARLLWFLRIEAPAPVATETFLAALRTQIKAEPTLADLADVYLLRTPTNWSLPCLIVSPIRGTFEVTTKRKKLFYPEIQFTVLSADDQQAWDLGESAFRALDPDRDEGEGGYIPVLHTDGAEAMRWPTYAQQFALYPGRSKDNKVVCSYSFGYKFYVTR